MFGFLLSQAARARRDARNWIEVADKVINYRRDQLPENELGELQQRRDELKAAVKAKVDAAKIKLGIGALEPVLHRCGGSVYPKGATADNVEFFLAAAIVILGIKAFFLQPFKIPTNSMWPSYFGMTAEVWDRPAEAPSWPLRIGRLATFLAIRHEFVAEGSGEVMIPFQYVSSQGRIFLQQRQTKGRTWLVFPAAVKEYTIAVGPTVSHVQVPLDFRLEEAITDKYLGGGTSLPATLKRLEAEGRIRRPESRTAAGADGWYLLKTGLSVKAGEVAFAFDVMGGDQLVVDRFSNHFFPPKVGEGFVFRTGQIPAIGGDQYYVKRLVGTPGDRLEIREPVLYRNGSPITGAEAFRMNAGRFGLYRGYKYGDPADASRGYLGLLQQGEVQVIPGDTFFAMGDNSYNSLDSRFWGFVPAKDAVGRPLFIYYPFTKRWGPAN